MLLDINKDVAWIRNHVILLLLAAGLSFGAVYFVDNLMAKHASENDKKWQVILGAQELQTQAVQSQLTQDETKWAAVNVQLMNANQKLSAAITSRDAALAAQVKVDATLSATQTAAKLGGTANGEDITLPLDTGRGIAISLDTLAGTQQDLADTKTKLTNETTIAEDLQSNLDEQEKLISAMKTQATDAVQSCKATVAAVKAEARKSKLRWLGMGWILGMLSARALGI